MTLWGNGTNINEIAKQCKISLTTAYEWKKNCSQSGSVNKVSKDTFMGRPNRMSIEDEEALRDYLLSYGWMDQKDMVNWLETTRNVKVSQSTLSRMLRRNAWTIATFGHRDGRNISSLPSASQEEDVDPALRNKIESILRQAED